MAGLAVIVVVVSAAVCIYAIAIVGRRPDVRGADWSGVPGADGPYRVVRVVDGDTVKVKPESGAAGEEDTVRLIGVDTPETHDPRKPVQCFGPEAARFTTRELTGRQVWLAADPVAGARDHFHRRLAYLWGSPDDLFNLRLVRRGFAREYDYRRQRYRYRGEFTAAQAAARAEASGLWSPTTCAGRVLTGAVGARLTTSGGNRGTAGGAGGGK